MGAIGPRPPPVIGEERRAILFAMYTVIRMARPKSDSTVLTIRVPVTLDRRLAREARRRRQTRSEVARAILEAELGGEGGDLAAEARRQSLLVRRRRSERDALEFLLHVADAAQPE